MRFIRSWLPVVVWSAIILWASSPRFSSIETATWLDRLFGPGVPEWANLMARKAGHVLAYGLLGVLAFRASRTSGPHRRGGPGGRFAPLLIALLIVVVVASTDEWHQSTIATRTGTPWDVVLDACSAFVAVISVFPAARAFLWSRDAAE